MVAVALAAGCGKARPVLGQVEGQVRLGDKPLANVVVQFLPDLSKETTGPPSSAVTDDEGHYHLRCDNQEEGAVVGWHRVVLCEITTERVRQGQERKQPPRVPERYRAAATTPLRVEVKPEAQTIDLEVVDQQPGGTDVPGQERGSAAAAGGTP